MKTTLIVLALVACALAASKPQLKRVHPVFAKWNRNPKIVGGTEAVPHSIPYQVGLFLDGSFCGGSLINKRWVLTAAHCGVLTDRPTVILGAHAIRDSTEETQVELTGSRVIVHEEYDPNEIVNDIALIELPSDAPLNENIATVGIAPANASDYAGQTAVASGWGLDSDEASTISDVLRVTSSPILTNEQCESDFLDLISIPKTNICLDGSNGNSTCNGDSGGPLTVDGVQVGLTSFGIIFGCELGFPSAFTRLSEFNQWVSDNTNLEF